MLVCSDVVDAGVDVVASGVLVCSVVVGSGVDVGVSLVDGSSVASVGVADVVGSGDVLSAGVDVGVLSAVDSGVEVDVEVGDAEDVDVGAWLLLFSGEYLYSSKRRPAPQYSDLSPGQIKSQSFWFSALTLPSLNPLPQ